MTQACGKSVSNHPSPEPFDAIACDFHCVNRCVRRSWLCGDDEYIGKNFEHRKPWVEKRILELGNIFACGIYSWAVMSNHLHIVVHMMSAGQKCRLKPAQSQKNVFAFPPVRAKIASGTSTSRNTSIKSRNQQIRKVSERANQPLMPLIGVKSFNVPNLTECDYIELVDFTGCEWHAGKRGKIESSEPKALTKLGLDQDHWTTRVKGIGSGYWRVVGELEELVDKAKEMAQRTLFGTGLARILSKI
jgi:hypothetical protein